MIIRSESLQGCRGFLFYLHWSISYYIHVISINYVRRAIPLHDFIRIIKSDRTGRPQSAFKAFPILMNHGTNKSPHRADMGFMEGVPVLSTQVGERQLKLWYVSEFI